MKQQIEDIVKKNLPENKKLNDDAEEFERGIPIGFNQALSQINTSLIADEVLKVVKQTLEENLDKHCIYEVSVESLLSNLSPNKKNVNKALTKLKTFRKKKQCVRGCECDECMWAEAEMSDFNDD